MWSETKKRPIVNVLRRTASRLAALPSDADVAKSLAEINAEIAKREADPAFQITLRHIGTPSEPFLKRELDARTARADHEADKRARKSLLADGAEVNDNAVTMEKMRDPAWQREFGELARAWIVAGVVGDGEFERLYNLGGPDLLLHAMREVQAFQEVSDEDAKS